MIPKEFTIGGMKYHVKIMDSSKDIDNNLGDFCEIGQEIRLVRSSEIDGETINLSNDKIEEIFFHELGHCFGVYYNDDHSEELACAFSHFMFEYFKSAKE